MAPIGGGNRSPKWACRNAGVCHDRRDLGNVIPATRDFKKLFSVGLNAGEDRHDLARGIALPGAMHSVEIIGQANCRKDSDDGHGNRQFWQGEPFVGTGGCVRCHVDEAEKWAQEPELAAARFSAGIQHRLHIDLAGVEVGAALHDLVFQACIC